MRKLLLFGCIAVALFGIDGYARADQPTGQVVTAQVQPQAAEPALPADTLRLDDVINEALRKNPGIQAALHTVNAQRRRVPQVKSLPDPMVGVGWAGNIQPFSVQTGDPSSYRSFSATQTLPFPGKLKLRGEIASKEADASYWDYEAARRKVVADVKAAFYDYFYYYKALGTTRQNKDLLTKLSKIADARYRVGKGLQQDVLKSQVEISRLLQTETMQQQQLETAQARLNTLMARPPESPLPPPAEITATPLTASIDEIYELARKNDPELQRDVQMIERNQLAVNLAQKDYKPDFSVGYMYQQRPQLPDMHGVTVTLNIPIFYKTKQREEVKQAVEEKTSAEQTRDNRRNELYFELKQDYLAAKASDQLLQLYSHGVVPQSSLALESSMSDYQVGNADFLTVFTNFSTILEYETEYYRELANYQTSLAQIESLIGVDVSQVPTQQPAPEAPEKKQE